MLNGLRRLFTKRNESPFVVVQAGGDYGQLPEGFFKSLGGAQTQIGFYCPKCKYVLRHGAHNGVTHCGKHEMPPPADAGPLPQVRWEYANMPGTNGVVANVGGNRVVDSDSLETFKGDFAYKQADPASGKENDFEPSFGVGFSKNF